MGERRLQKAGIFTTRRSHLPRFPASSGDQGDGLIERALHHFGGRLAGRVFAERVSMPDDRGRVPRGRGDVKVV
jgi:hypothetical protein